MGCVDISAFDFSPAELTALLVELATVAKAIEVEPRLHHEDETARTPEGIVKMHEGLTGPTFRIQCRLRRGDNVVGQLAVIESALGVVSVLDRDRSVRIRHERVGVATG
jgi:hypothetical protein